MTTPRDPLTYGFKIRLAPQTGSLEEKKHDDLEHQFFVNPPDLGAVSFKGGGVRVFVYRQFLEIAEKMGIWAGVKEVGGSSSGALMAAFAAVHYEDPKERTKSLEYIHQADGQDVMRDTSGWNFYRRITSPLNYLSQGIKKGAKLVHDAANYLNSTRAGKIIGYPLKGSSYVVRAASALTSPENAAAAFNLIFRGGMFYGEKINQRARERFRQDVEAGFKAVLAKIPDEKQQQKIIEQFKAENFLDEKGHVVEDITFKHLALLSKLPNSKFKEHYSTGVRVKDGELVVFNAKNTPNMPIYLAFRIAMTFPKFYQLPTYEGDTYFDGGAIDNSPVRHATNDPRLLREIDNLSRLAVRVDYKDQLQNILWEQLHLDNSLKFKIKSFVLARLSFGIDSYATQQEEFISTRNEFEQRALQLPDFGIKRMDTNLNEAKRNEVCQEIERYILDYFENHENEKLIWQNFRKWADEKIVVKDLPVNLQKLLQDEVLLNRKDCEKFVVCKDYFASTSAEQIKKFAPDKIEDQILYFEFQRNAKEKLIKEKNSLLDKKLLLQVVSVNSGVSNEAQQQLALDIEHLKKELEDLGEELKETKKNLKELREIMRPQIQILLFEFLVNPKVKTEDIFCIPSKSLAELEELREREITKLEKLPIIQRWKKSSAASANTADIFRKTQAKDMPTVTWHLEEEKTPEPQVVRKRAMTQPVIAPSLSAQPIEFRRTCSA